MYFYWNLACLQFSIRIRAHNKLCRLFYNIKHLDISLTPSDISRHLQKFIGFSLQIPLIQTTQDKHETSLGIFDANIACQNIYLGVKVMNETKHLNCCCSRYIITKLLVNIIQW